MSSLFINKLHFSLQLIKYQLLPFVPLNIKSLIFDLFSFFIRFLLFSLFKPLLWTIRPCLSMYHLNNLELLSSAGPFKPFLVLISVYLSYTFSFPRFSPFPLEPHSLPFFLIFFPSLPSSRFLFPFFL